MILVLGSPKDALVNVVLSHGERNGLTIKSLSEEELFDRTIFCYQRDGKKLHGIIHLDGESVSMGEIGGVLLRLNRTWWPSSSFSHKDQMFVYHETIASWFNFFTSLSCPVINRFSLGWWLQDVTYPESLRRQLANLLKLETTACDNVLPDNGRLVTTRSPNNLSSIYLVGDSLIVNSPRMESLAGQLQQEGEFKRWQEDNGITLCRLDFEPGRYLKLRCIEAFPLIENEKPELIEQIGSATIGLLA